MESHRWGDEWGARVSDLATSVEVDQPNAARMYDYYLGGSANFAIDREAAEDALLVMPHVRTFACANRAFMGRAVRYLLDEGVDQFLDLGSGIPTVGNVHEIAQWLRPGSRVAYVDFEPVAVAHARTLLAGLENVTMTQADIREPEKVLDAPGVAELLDFTRPVAVLAVAILPFITDNAEAAAVVARYRDTCVPRSYLVVSHISPTSVTPEQLQYACALMERTSTPIKWRTPTEIGTLLRGYVLVEPGLVPTPEWRPDPGRKPDWLGDATMANAYAAVGYLPRPGT
jgi:hypothetical protein